MRPAYFTLHTRSLLLSLAHPKCTGSPRSGIRPSFHSLFPPSAIPQSLSNIVSGLSLLTPSYGTLCSFLVGGETTAGNISYRHSFLSIVWVTGFIASLSLSFNLLSKEGKKEEKKGTFSQEVGRFQHRSDPFLLQLSLHFSGDIFRPFILSLYSLLFPAKIAWIDSSRRDLFPLSPLSPLLL